MRATWAERLRRALLQPIGGDPGWLTVIGLALLITGLAASPAQAMTAKDCWQSVVPTKDKAPAVRARATLCWCAVFDATPQDKKPARWRDLRSCADSHAELGDFDAAIARYREALTWAPAAERPKIEARLRAKRAESETVRLTCAPSTTVVELNGVSRGGCPATLRLAPPGPHQLIATAPGHQPQQRALSARAHRTVAIVLEPLRPAERSAIGPILLGAAGLIAVGVGGYFDYRNSSDYDDLVASRRRGEDDRQLYDQSLSAYNRALGSYVVGGLLLTGGLTWYLWPDEGR